MWWWNKMLNGIQSDWRKMAGLPVQVISPACWNYRAETATVAVTKQQNPAIIYHPCHASSSFYTMFSCVTFAIAAIEGRKFNLKFQQLVIFMQTLSFFLCLAPEPMLGGTHPPLPRLCHVAFHLLTHFQKCSGSMKFPSSSAQRLTYMHMIALIQTFHFF